jgi:hypothetical protein
MNHGKEDSARESHRSHEAAKPQTLVLTADFADFTDGIFFKPCHPRLFQFFSIKEETKEL